MGDHFLNVVGKLKSKIPNLPKMFDTVSQRFNDYSIAEGVAQRKKIHLVSEEFVYK